MFFLFPAEDGIRDRGPSRGLGDVYTGQSVTVDIQGFDARASSMYALGDVTGLDFEVMEVILTQARMACALLAACEAIEAHNSYEFAFVCHGATHRSVGCCVLLAAMMHYDATFVLTPARTRAAAIARQLV